ncbi:IclR family transcriptional regulator [Agrococcus carbonis]|uniref:DNA binding domain-containing protein, excisionase family n=1 Tax=Agrococcus carbonis TaxID=684552 RepID=A0A1H1NQ79_9MICO|nr:helix-turn-helix domain-containing protein [Agrococcus carbonis]SDS01122.1 DNA binding domain-containing protein, excisionase family [Agrococcus carbonis]
MAESEKTAAGSQTLARGLAALAMIGESDTPITVRELAERLGIHRSMVYRLVATLEQSGFVERTGGGELQIGIRLVGIARTAARDLQTVALPELLAAADELDATVFLAAYDGEAAVTLVSAEPRNAHAVVAQRPGSRHPIGRGAPARVIRSQVDPVAHPPARFEESHDEVYAGLAAIAVPLLLPGGRPMAIAALHLAGRPVDPEPIVARLEGAAERIRSQLH